MARTFTTPLHVARHVIASAEAWLLFVWIPRRGAGGGEYRAVAASRNVDADGRRFQAMNFSIGEIPEETLDGDLPRSTLTLSNVSRIPMALIELENELLGQTASFALAPQGALSSFAPGLTWTMTVLAADCTEASVTLELGHPAAIERVPKGVYDRTRFPQLLPQGLR